MYRFSRLLSLLFLIITLIFSATNYSIAADDAIIAIVNDELITLSDLKEYLRSTATQLRLEGRTTEEINAILPQLEADGLRRLIEDKLVLDAANNAGLEVNKKIIDKRYAEIRKRYTSEQEFLNSILSIGVTPSDIRNKIRGQLKIKFIIGQEVRSKIYITPPEVTDYYKKHFEDYQRKERVNLDSIFIARGQDMKKARKKTEQALNLLQEGKDFLQVAQEFSEAPSVGIIERGRMIPAIEDVAFGLTLNEISPIVESESGLFIFKLKEKSSSDVIPLQEVKDKIYDKIYQIKLKEKLASWINKLKEEAFIEIK
ncbi:MAG: peptidyl-prolyl cis-trans isomerase [Candidatus Omnitrophica bacterium]|nr:peptidyl-prolyl cis-trans isomerase [Candidatus Omnitrophota bacterium]